MISTKKKYQEKKQEIKLFIKRTMRKTFQHYCMDDCHSNENVRKKKETMCCYNKLTFAEGAKICHRM